MKSKLLHEHSMAEYLYTRPELLEEGKLGDMWDVVSNPKLYTDALGQVVQGAESKEDYKSTLEDIGDDGDELRGPHRRGHR